MTLHVSLQRETDELLRQPNLRLRIGDHLVDIGALRVLTGPGQPRLTSKAMAVLIELVRNAGNTVTRDQLLDSVWKGRCPTPDVLTQAIKELRRAFSDDSRPARFIETIPKVGYRLLPRVLVLDAPDGGVFVEAPGLSLDTDGSLHAGASDAAESAEPATSPAPVARNRWRVPALLMLAGALALVLVIASRLEPSRAPVASAAKASTWQVREMRVLTSDPGAERLPRLSPDGTRVAYGILDPDTHYDRVVVRSIVPSQLIHLTLGANEHEAQPVWSPDGMRIAFERLQQPACTMHVTSSLGGGERDVGTCRDFRSNYYDWTPDGKSLVMAERTDDGKGVLALVMVNLDDGSKHFLDYERAADDQDLQPHYSPDGTRLAFRRGLAPYSDLYVMAAAGGPVRRITHLAARMGGYTWTRDSGALVFASEHAGPMALYAVEVESGEIQALGVSPAAYPDTARDNDLLVYQIPRTQSTLTEVTLDGGTATPPRPLAPSTGSDHSPRLSPDGNRVVFASDRSGQHQIWLHDLAAGTTRPLTDESGNAVISPRWSADGTHVVAVQHDAQGRKLIEIDIASQRRRVLSMPGENVLLGTYGFDADGYLFVSGSSGRDNQLVLVRHPGEAEETRVVLARAVAAVEPDPATHTVYYTPTAERGLFRVDPSDGVEHLVTSKLTSVTNGWRVVDGRIWYVGDIEVHTASLHELDPASGADRVIGRIDAIMRDLQFSVTPDRKRLIAVPLTAEDTDIGVLRLTRDGTGTRATQ